jgi:limonene-1,2-epoxide hydrolase
MSPTISEIAEAFSRHEFDRSFPHTDDDIEWTQIGEGHIRGKADVVTTCESRMSTTYAVEIDSSAAD